MKPIKKWTGKNRLVWRYAERECLSRGVKSVCKGERNGRENVALDIAQTAGGCWVLWDAVHRWWLSMAWYAVMLVLVMLVASEENGSSWLAGFYLPFCPRKIVILLRVICMLNLVEQGEYKERGSERERKTIWSLRWAALRKMLM